MDEFERAADVAGYWTALLDGRVHCPDCGRMECAAERESLTGCHIGPIRVHTPISERQRHNVEWIKQFHKATELLERPRFQPPTEEDPPASALDAPSLRVALLELITGKRLTPPLVVGAALRCPNCEAVLPNDGSCCDECDWTAP